MLSSLWYFKSRGNDNGWMFGAELEDKLSQVELRQNLEIKDVVVGLQRHNRLRWSGRVLSRGENDSKVMCRL